MRDAVAIYWSHCASWRINHPALYGPAITEGVGRVGAEARERGFSALKTNMFVHERASVRAWMAGFGAPVEPGLNVDPALMRSVRSHLEATARGRTSRSSWTSTSTPGRRASSA